MKNKSVLNKLKGDRKFSPSFILFFILMLFLIGEQIIALPLYIVGPIGDQGPDKLHILDLAPLDAIHRPLFYFLFGLIGWIILRLIRWPLAWISAFVIWNIFQLVPPSKPGLSIFVFFGVGFFLLVPYFIHQGIDRKWGKKGRWNAILVLGVINVLLLSFFAYQIYGLQNSYRNNDNSRGSFFQNQSTENKQLTNTENYPTLNMIAPYFNESDIRSIGPYGNTENSPWGFKHVGIDFMSASNLIPIRAVADGTIEMLKTSKENEQQGWHTELCLNHNPFLICYNFETFSSNEAVEQKQKNNIFVKNGDKVKQGDLIGKLVRGGDGAHLDLGVLQTGANGQRICPEDYFTEDAKASILRLIHKDHPDWKMCYE